ncbi:hypothetical protein ACGC1H_004905 [Rhizoctonia solani]
MASTSGFNQRPVVFNNEGGRFANGSTYALGLGPTTPTPWVPSLSELSNAGANEQFLTSGEKQSSFPRMKVTPIELGGTSQEHSGSTNVTSTQSPAVPNSSADSPASDRIVIAVTHDKTNYVDLDITNHLGDAQAIRREIATKITNNPHSQFNISRIASPTVSLGDDELLITCLYSGDDHGTLKFFVHLVSNTAPSNRAAFHAPPPPPALPTRLSMPEPCPWYAEGTSPTGGISSSHHLGSPIVADLDRSGDRYQNPITNIDGKEPMPEHASPITQPPSEPDAARFFVPYHEDPIAAATPGTSVSSLPSPSTPPVGRSYIARNTLHSEPHEMSTLELQQHMEQLANTGDTARPAPDAPRGGTISRKMTMDEVLHELYLHGCKNITPYLNRSMSGDSPVAGGGFGDVYRGALNNGTDVGLKCVRLEVDSDDGGKKKVKDAARELYIWSKCKHPNILELIGVTQHRNQIAMVSPWMANGDLTRFLHTHPETNRYDLCAQIADGVAYMHQENVVHGDLKGANILMSKEHTPKITDFGTASRTGYTLQFTETTRSQTLSLRWTAPEIIAETTDQNTFKTDVFSLGMTILEVITGLPPYAGINDGAVVLRLVTGKHPARPEAHIPTGDERADLLWALLSDCWALSPQDRPTALEVRDRVSSLMRSIALM